MKDGNMAQFIQYLYEYQKGERIRNLGFMKVEQQMDKMVIQIYAKQMDDVKGIQFQKENGDKYIATWEMSEENKETVENLEQQEEVETYIPPSTRRFEKIQRQDLARLPKKEWRIANNSFLLHGYYNYHHLLYIEEDHKIWIGVPGIFHEKEKAAASAFGFGEFRRLTDWEIELSEEEKNTYEDFGYWCRQVEKS